LTGVFRQNALNNAVLGQFPFFGIASASVVGAGVDLEATLRFHKARKRSNSLKIYAPRKLINHPGAGNVYGAKNAEIYFCR
jgi:hypothetical protein